MFTQKILHIRKAAEVAEDISSDIADLSRAR